MVRSSKRLIASCCRLGELLALTWRDVDLACGTILVSSTLHRVDGEYRRRTPKTATSQLALALPSEGREAVRRQKAQQTTWWEAAGDAGQSSGLVFTGRTGRPLHHSVVTHALRRECQRLGI